jgi:hypothetical protein
MPKLLPPPPRVVVSYCADCGIPIVADLGPHMACCPQCPYRSRTRTAVYILRQPQSRKRTS